MNALLCSCLVLVVSATEARAGEEPQEEVREEDQPDITNLMSDSHFFGWGGYITDNSLGVTLKTFVHHKVALQALAGFRHQLVDVPRERILWGSVEAVYEGDSLFSYGSTYVNWELGVGLVSYSAVNAVVSLNIQGWRLPFELSVDYRPQIVTTSGAPVLDLGNVGVTLRLYPFPGERMKRPAGISKEN